MVSNPHTLQIQGIRFVNDFPEATLFTVSFDQSSPLDLQVIFDLGADETCRFELSRFLLNRALFPSGYNLRAFLPFTSGATQVTEFRPTTEGDFQSGFISGVLFDFCVDGIEYQIWLPQEEVTNFVVSIPSSEDAEAGTYDLDSSIIAQECELESTGFRPRPLALRDTSNEGFDPTVW